MIASGSAACPARLCAVSRERLDRNIARMCVLRRRRLGREGRQNMMSSPSRAFRASPMHLSGLITLDRVHWVGDKGAHDPPPLFQNPSPRAEAWGLVRS